MEATREEYKQLLRNSREVLAIEVMMKELEIKVLLKKLEAEPPKPKTRKVPFRLLSWKEIENAGYRFVIGEDGKRVYIRTSDTSVNPTSFLGCQEVEVPVEE